MLRFGRALGQEMWLVQQRNVIARMSLFLTWFVLNVNVTEPMDHCDDPDNIRWNVHSNVFKLPSKAEVHNRLGWGDIVVGASKSNTQHGAYRIEIKKTRFLREAHSNSLPAAPTVRWRHRFTLLGSDKRAGVRTLVRMWKGLHLLRTGDVIQL